MSPKVLIIDGARKFRATAREYVLAEWPGAQVEEWDPRTHGRPDAGFDWNRHNVVLLDYTPGGDSGLDWLAWFRTFEQCPPIVFITAAGSEEVAVEAMKLGAVDYLRKDNLTRARLTQSICEALASQPTRADSVRSRVLPDTTAAIAALRGLDVASDLSLPRSRAGGGRPVRIAGYTIMREIGSGAMATVHLAQRASDEQQLVLKIINARMAHDHELITRFMREYAIVSKMQNPFMVKIYDQGVFDDQPYIAMEYFSGGDLEKRIRAGIAPRKALDLLSQIAVALVGLHANGVVHRDLKPANIMFRGDGSLGILDFGIAKVADGRPDITGHGNVVGTPYYLSPEQAQSLPVDGRSDLYSAGVVFFEMLTGRRPFIADSARAAVRKHIEEPVPRLEGRLARYQELVDMLMAKRPEYRFQDGRELLAYLEERFNFGT